MAQFYRYAVMGGGQMAIEAIVTESQSPFFHLEASGQHWLLRGVFKERRAARQEVKEDAWRRVCSSYDALKCRSISCIVPFSTWRPRGSIGCFVASCARAARAGKLLRHVRGVSRCSRGGQMVGCTCCTSTSCVVALHEL